MHSVAKVHFLLKNYKFLKSLKIFYFCVKIDFFSSKKKSKYLNFRA